ncbi:MAG: TonB-dependent receptor [Kangiellaceae bacterium]|jgi:iron complex outermembrane receptor protein|nr:TonB-dependent receptor [Kangiellaceae bacterium]
MHKKTLIAVALASALTQAADFNGKLVDHNNKPLSNVSIVVRDQGVTVKTNDAGEFKLDLPKGQYTLDIEHRSAVHFHQKITVGDSAATQTVHVDAEHSNTLIITANPLDHTKLDMATPAIVLSGNDLLLRRSSTLGDMLRNEPGISVDSFGPAVSRPVIRGLSGPRVMITTNQMTVQDVSVTSADHDVSLEPMLAEQIEVIKGPATLLYGSGAIGGIVNVVDKRFNPEGADGIEGGVELRLGDSVTGEQSLITSVTGGDESFGWHFDAFSNEIDNITIPVDAESNILRAAEGEELEADEGDYELESSQMENSGFNAGLTWNSDAGYFGIALSQNDKIYGVPGHSHGHEEEHEEGHMGEEEEESVSIDMEQTRIDVQGAFYKPFEGVDEWFFGLANTDYQHVELEGAEIGSQYGNDATELRSYIKHDSLDGWDGIVGIQYIDRDFSALGDEAFVPPSQTENTAFFVIEEKRFGDHKLELGFRAESVSVGVDGFSEFSDTTLSYSIGDVISLNDDDVFAVNLAVAERAPIAEELYSFGEHVATDTFDVGNTNLTNETSTNFDVSYRFNSDGISGEINAYINNIDNFIFGGVMDNNGFVTDLNGVITAIDPDETVIMYQQRDAEFSGIEVDVAIPLVSAEYDLTLGLMADYIHAEFTNGDGAYVPRIPPIRFGMSLQYVDNDLSAVLNWIDHSSQEKTANNELPTDGFTILDLEVSYKLDEGNSMLFLRGQNLLDEEARDHASFLKDLAPRAGRNFVAGIRYNF